jgi:hypothetical protein
MIGQDPQVLFVELVATIGLKHIACNPRLARTADDRVRLTRRATDKNPRARAVQGVVDPVSDVRAGFFSQNCEPSLAV